MKMESNPFIDADCKFKLGEAPGSYSAGEGSNRVGHPVVTMFGEAQLVPSKNKPSYDYH